MATHHLISYILPISLLLVAASAQFEPTDCVYTFYIKTGDVDKAGTDSKISVILGDNKLDSVEIPNLQKWGLMGGRYDYFEKGNVDVFSVRSSCDVIPSPCRIMLTSDGRGSYPAWFVEYVEVTSTGPHVTCSQNIFFINTWLSSDPDYGLSVNVDNCKYNVTQPKEEKKKKKEPSVSVLRKVVESALD